MHIGIVSRGLPSTKNPLNGIFEWDQARALKRAGNKVTFIVLDLRSIRRKRKLTNHSFIKEGIRVVYGSVPLGNVPASCLYFLGKRKLNRLLTTTIYKNGKPDILHGHFTDIGAITASVAKQHGIPCVVTEHSSSLNLDKLSGRTIYMAKRAYNDASNLVAVSEGLKNRITQHFNKQPIVIPNIVDVDSIRFSRANQNRTGRTLRFVATGALIKRKGYDVLLDSFAQLPRNSAELRIIGEGPERPNLERQIFELGLNDSVKLLGQKTRAEISNIYSEADCFVLATRRETFGVVYIEAMLAGLPVIATRCGGPEDFVNDDNGVLVSPESVRELTDALKMMIEKSRLYNAKNLNTWVINTFGPDVIANQLTHVYLSLL